jgi:putative transposase
LRHPRDYRWSSYRALAAGATDPVLTLHDLYQGLGRTPADRQSAYRALFRTALDAGLIDELRAATNGGWVLGDERFKRHIGKVLRRQVVPLPRGRPARNADKRRQLKLLNCTPSVRHGN